MESPLANDNSIHLRGVRTNNLKNVDVAIPLGGYTVVTGKSGSGKSSLVFDTLYGEAYRRYTESLSSFARQYLKSLPKPEIDDVKNIPAAIAVKQTRAGKNNRSTVGTMTELDDLLRVVFAHGSEVHCCGKVLRKESNKSACEDSYKRWPDQQVLVMASMEHWSKLKASELKTHLAGQGFTRAYVNEEIVRIEGTPAKTLKEGYVIIDRVKLSETNFHRMMESCGLGFKLGRGTLTLLGPDNDQAVYSSRLECMTCKEVFLDPSPSLFNFNSPLGACDSCQGFGRVPVLDHYKIFPHDGESVLSHGVAPWNFGKHVAYFRVAINSAKARGIDPAKTFDSYSDDDWDWIYNGDGGSFKGVQGYFAWLDSKKYKAHYRIHSARFHSYDICDLCEGQRLKPSVLKYKVENSNFSEVSGLTLKNLEQWFQDVGTVEDQNKSVSVGMEEAVKEAVMRLTYLITIGVHYLHLGRSSKTLSGGEVQRINMARSLGSNLTDTLFCLDEPSSGLHPRDSQNLLSVIKSLRDQGNTVVVVEHEQGIIEGADYLIQVGPAAGHEGGEITYSGVPTKQGQGKVSWNFSDKKPSKASLISIKDASIHNLKNVTASMPLNSMVVVCGVSGSGKTSLVKHTFFPLLCQAIGKAWEGEEFPESSSLEPASILEPIKDAFLMSQEPIGRSTRSNIASYLGMFTEIRKIFSNTVMAKAQGIKPGFFSFNVSGGRCEECKGLGVIEEDLSFLGDMEVTCPKCQGLRFQESVLDIKYKDRNLLEVLGLTVAEAKAFFFDVPKILKTLNLVQEVGMDYITLGQHTSSFSGGEAQRLKILSFLLENKNAEPRIFIFDEPTTGLSDTDVKSLTEQFRLLINKGHSVVVVEHHLGVIKSADWVLEMGPEAATAGGQLVFQGRPEDLAKQQTITGNFLRSYDSN